MIVVVAVSALAISGLINSRHALLDTIDPANLEADQLLVAYLNEETGVRGYVLSGNRLFLQPYELGFTEARASSKSLNTLLSRQPGLLELAHGAEAAGSKWDTQFAQPAIAAVGRRKSPGASQAALLRSKSLFDAVRARFSHLDAALAVRRSSAQASLASATDDLIGTLVAALVAFVLSGILSARSLRSWVTAPLESIGADSRAVAGGDITHSITPIGPPDLRRHGQDIEKMRERIVSELAATEASRAEIALVNAELLRSNAELEQFAYVASHDLQEPLRKVTSFVQLLQQRYEGRLDERADQYIAFAVDGAKRMQGLINDLLAFSRVGRTTERFEEVDLASTVRTALAHLAEVIEQTHSEVTVGPLPAVKGDAALFVSLWQNLIGNAIKFRGHETPQVSVAATRLHGEWLCTVTDNGMGIEPRFAEKIFVLFQRLHSRETYPGTGIGLALARKIVEFHGGQIWLDLNHHPGTRMCFTLPISNPEVLDEHGD